MMQQILIANRGLIINPDAIGTKYLDLSNTAPYGSGSSARIDQTWTVPELWLPATYRVKTSITTTASYDTVGFTHRVYENAVKTKEWYQPSGHTGYFRHNSGTLSYAYDLTAEGGDEVRLYCHRGTRGTGPSPQSTHKISIELLSK